MKNGEVDHVLLDGRSVTPEEIVEVANGKKSYKLYDYRFPDMKRYRRHLMERAQTESIYGVNTGIGNFKDRAIPPEVIREYQRRYLNAHDTSAGLPFTPEVVIAAGGARANSFMKCFSGVRPELPQGIVNLLNAGVIPYIRREGSVGASGDLCPLSLFGSVLIGMPEAKAYYQDMENPIPAPEALRRAGLSPMTFEAKEALAMTNGSTFILAQMILAVPIYRMLFNLLCGANALTVEALRGVPGAFDFRLNGARPFAGQVKASSIVRQLLAGSARITKDARGVIYPWAKIIEVFEKDPKTEKKVRSFKRKDAHRVQDAYSIRCFPQIIEPMLAAIEMMHQATEIELNSATDNPLFFEGDDGKYDPVSGGNFHGQPLAARCDFMIMTAAKAAIASNHHFWQLLCDLNSHLPENLDLLGQTKTEEAGNSGMMILQYMTAAMSARLQKLSFPSSVLTFPTSGLQEDVVSMGSLSAVDLYYEVPRVIKEVVASEFLGAAQGISCTREVLGEYWKPSPANMQIYELIMDTIPRNDYAKDEGLAMADDHFLEGKKDAVVSILSEINEIILDNAEAAC